jgi:hypothetical protein
MPTVDPAVLLAGYRFRDRFEGEPRYRGEMPEVPQAGVQRGEWLAAGLAQWDEVIAQAALAPGARVLVVLPTGLNLVRLVAELVSRVPGAQRWAVGVCSGSDAAAAWNERVRVRLVVLADHVDAAAWPGEVCHDLRERPQAPRHAQAPMSTKAAPDLQGAGKGDARWISLGDEPTEAAAGAGAEPIEVRFGGAGAIEIGAIRAVSEPEGEKPQAARSGSGWGIVLVWFGIGAVVGALVAFILASFLR